MLSDRYNIKHRLSVLLLVFTQPFSLAQTMSVQGAPVKIFYGLNESHSRSWAQNNNDGLIGISYFKIKNENNSNDLLNNADGELRYKTITSEGKVMEEIVAKGKNLEISNILYDAFSRPNIFVAHSNYTEQNIIHFSKVNGTWISDTISINTTHGGKHIYELSAAKSTDGSFHLLALITRSNPDSDDYYYAFLDANLYHISNIGGNWNSEHIVKYDMLYTNDEYAKVLIRQDIKIDVFGNIHIVFEEQINGTTNYSPSRLRYATNKSGNWVFETAMHYNQGSRDDAGFYPSLALDGNGTPYILSTYVSRVNTGSAMSAKLILSKKINLNNWERETVEEYDDGYYSRDGRDYTGGLNHLVFDRYNIPHIVFTDIASMHSPRNCWCLGNIRYGIKNGNSWELKTIYRQDLPQGYYNSSEIYGLCLLLPDGEGEPKIIAQQLDISSENEFTFKLLNFDLSTTTGIEENIPYNFLLEQNYPNPFNPSTKLEYQIHNKSHINLSIYSLTGEFIKTLVDDNRTPGVYEVNFNGHDLSSGIYLCRLTDGKMNQTKKMILLR